MVDILFLRINIKRREWLFPLVYLHMLVIISNFAIALTLPNREIRMKKILLLIVAILLCVTTEMQAYDIKIGAIYYNYINNSTELEVTYSESDEPLCTDSWSYEGDVVIPEEVTILNRTRKVTRIGYGAFAHCHKLNSVVIPNSVRTISSYAFYHCEKLKTITIGNSVESIEGSCFYKCDVMESVNISDMTAWCKIKFASQVSNPLSQAHNLYLNGELVTDLVIPNTITSVEQYAFTGCSALTSVVIPNSVTSVGYAAFKGCSQLASVTMDKSVSNIGADAFEGCKRGKVFIPDLESWCKINFSNAESNPLLGGYLYVNNSNVSTLEIPNTVTSIKQYAFCYSRFNSVNIPNSVTSIGTSAFGWCSNLKTAAIGNSVKTIGDEAFRYCSNLTTATIGNSVVTIGKNAFSDCRTLSSVSIPNSVTNIGSRAFYSCPLTSVVIPNSVVSIGDEAFRYCSKLASATIGNSVSSMGTSVFAGCTSLADIYCLKKTPCTISANVFDNLNYNNSTLYVPTGAKENYKSTNYWSKFVFVEEMPYVVTDILSFETHTDGTAALLGFKDGYDAETETLDIPEKVTMEGKEYTVTRIEDRAFQNNSVLTSVTIPASVTQIGFCSFYNCKALKNVSIPKTVTSIESAAFHKCENLRSFVIDAANPYYSVQDFILYNKDKTQLVDMMKTYLVEYVVPEHVTSIDTYAFFGCYYLASVTIHDKVSYIGYGAFQNCSDLQEMILKSTVPPSLGSKCFDGSAYASGTLYVPRQSVEKYRSASQWNGWGAIKYVTIASGWCGDNVQYEIDETGLLRIWGNGQITSNPWMNSGCDDKFDRVEIEEGVTGITYVAFQLCPSLKTISIPSTVTNIEEGAFLGSTSLATIIVDSNNKYYTVDDGVLFNKDKTVLICCTPTKKGEYVVPKTVTRIAACAFWACAYIEALKIEGTLNSIGNYAFFGCSRLEMMHCESTIVPQLGIDVFVGVPVERGALYVYRELGKYMAADQWKTWRTIDWCVSLHPKGKHLEDLEKIQEHLKIAEVNSETFYDEFMAHISDGYLLYRKPAEKLLRDCIDSWCECIKEGHCDVTAAIERELYGDELSEDDFRKILDKYNCCPKKLDGFYYYLLSFDVTAKGCGQARVDEYMVRDESKKFYYLYSKAPYQLIGMNNFFGVKTELTLNVPGMYDYASISVAPDEGYEVESFVDGRGNAMPATDVQIYEGSYAVTFCPASGIVEMDAPAAKRSYHTLDGRPVSDPTHAKGVIIVNDGKKVRKVIAK